MLRYSRLRTPRQWRGALNMTPLVDIVFQLLVFYMLVSQVVTPQREPMFLPRPDHSQARQKSQSDRMVINLFVDAEGKLGKIKLNAHVVPDLSELVDLLLRNRPSEGIKRAVLRADRRLQFDQIEPVLKAISNASISSLEIATEHGAPTEEPQ